MFVAEVVVVALYDPGYSGYAVDVTVVDVYHGACVHVPVVCVCVMARPSLRVRHRVRVRSMRHGVPVRHGVHVAVIERVAVAVRVACTCGV